MIRMWSWFLGGLLLVLPVSRAAEGNSNAGGDAAWVELLKKTNPPVPPAEWNNKPPTAEQRAAFQKQAGDAADKVADEIKKFYETYPNHPKAEEAHNKEKTFRQLAGQLRTEASQKEEPQKTVAAEPESKASAPSSEEIDPAFQAKYIEAMSVIRAARQFGPGAVLSQFDKYGHQLAKQFPKRIEPWQMLMTVAENIKPEIAPSYYQEVASGAPDEGMRKFAASQARLFQRLGKPFELSFTAVDGRKVDVSKLKGKVVLIDFWATWCPGCVAAAPMVKRTYDELHDQGLEIVGVSFDEDIDEMKRFVAKNEIPWPQFCDGARFTNAINKEFQINGLPTMFFVDKKGVLRDMYALEGLRDKAKALLAEDSPGIVADDKQSIVR